jgi:hypothetical protein
MKKTIYFLTIFIVILSSCSSDNDSSSNSNIQINPPDWIQGKWLLEGALVGESGWRFTNNDFILIQVNTEVSQRGQLEQFANSGQEVSANDTFSDNSYSVTLNSIGGQSTTYSFTKVSDTKISWNTVATSLYIKQ